MTMGKLAATLAAVLVSLSVLARLSEGLSCYNSQDMKTSEVCASGGVFTVCMTRKCGDVYTYGCYKKEAREGGPEDPGVGQCDDVNIGGKACRQCLCTNDLCNVPKGDASHFRNSHFTWIWTTLLIVTAKLRVN